MTAEEENKILRAKLEVASLVLQRIADIQRTVRPNVLFLFPLEIEALARRGLDASIEAQRALRQIDPIRIER